MADLIAFLRARLDEDEALVPAPESWTAFDVNEPTGTRRVDVDHSFERVVACTRSWRGLHIARHDPARVLREVEAKRRALVRCEEELMAGMERLTHFIRQTLWEMTLPYADHPDYREEWRP
ncbi:DUF6221 family protein [Streptomyces uncialis]|uniref:DUF6221 family protein n=1 Tax=Streptomyces uncialis TaxID=1048205 RepID=UPI0038165C7C